MARHACLSSRICDVALLVAARGRLHPLSSRSSLSAYNSNFKSGILYGGRPEECSLNDFGKGLSEVLSGIIGGVIFSALLGGFAEDGLIPSYMVFLFAVAGFLGAMAAMYYFQTAGIIFTLGWIVGAWLLKDMLTSFDFIVYLVVPIVALVIRVVWFFKTE